MKSHKFTPILLCLLVLPLSGCLEKQKAEQARINEISIELNEFHSKSLKSLTCENIDYQYERCGEYSWYSEIEYCQAKYTPVLMRCYGVKAK